VAPLVLIGVAAGFFSALFGVGGGILIVPLLIGVAHFHPRAATATSLAAIGVIALAGAVRYELEGEVHFGAAFAIGLPAAAGAVAGSSLQQRLGGRTLTILFAAFLVAVGVRFLIG
jgi:uncharacterized membrane protein YfcA